MRDFLTALLECSVTMSVLALAYIALTPLLAKRYSAKWLYYAWLVIVVGLIVPFRIHPGTALVQVNAVPVSPVPQAAGDAVFTSGAAAVPSVTPAAAAQPFPWVGFLFCLWLAGAVAFLLFHLASHLRFLRMVKRWSEPVNDTRLLEELCTAKERLGIAAPIGLRVCPSVSSPMTTGFVRPVILLPRNDFSSEELSYIFLHELVHWKRKDLWYKSLVVLATAIHWFNPVVYFAARAISSQCEISCDAEVVRGAEPEERRRYSETILGAIGNRSGVQTVFSTNFNGGKKNMKKRISSILDTKAKKAGLIILCTVLIGTAATGIIFASTAKQTNAQNSYVPSAEEASIRTVATQWAKAIKNRDIDAQSALLSKKYRARGYMADVSGSQVERYEVSVQENRATVTYHYAASDKSTGDDTQTLTFVKEDGIYKIDSYSGFEPTAKPAASSVESPVYTVAAKWAQAVKNHDGKAQFALLSSKYQAQGYGKYSENYWVTGMSSPWVESYKISEGPKSVTVAVHYGTSQMENYETLEGNHGVTVLSKSYDNSKGRNSVTVTFRYATSTGFAGDYEQTLSFVQEDGTYKIDSISSPKEVTSVSKDQMSQYQKLQNAVDAGHQPGLTQPEEVAMGFASGTLKISNLSTMYDKIDKSVEGDRATVTFQKDGKPVLRMELIQPVKKGTGGIWVVTSWTDGKTNETHAVS